MAVVFFHVASVRRAMLGAALVAAIPASAGAQTAAAPAKEEAPAKPAPAILREPLQAGAQTVAGWVPDWDKEKDANKRVVIAVYRTVSMNAECMLLPSAADDDTICGKTYRKAVSFNEPQAGVVHFVKVTPGEDGSFLAPIPNRLLTGQRVVATVEIGGDAPAASDPVAFFVEDLGDWGRVRSYVAAGVVVSHDREGFSEQDLAMTFAIDKAWLMYTPPRILDDAEEKRCTDAKDAKGETLNRRTLHRNHPCRTRRSDWGFKQFNSFLDVRLTAVPVAVETTDDEDAPAAETPDTTTEFIGARKAAVIQAGIYAPIYGAPTMWRYRDEPNALFVAPVIRWGIQTITESQTAAEPAPGTAPAPGSTTTAVPEDDDVYSFWSAGVGIGHYRLSNSRHRAPELISYMHVTIGKFEAFDRPEQKRGFRWAVEARLKIPDTPMQVGVDANLGKGPDTVAFVFATRFDVGELFARLKQF